MMGIVDAVQMLQVFKYPVIQSIAKQYEDTHFGYLRQSTSVVVVVL